MRAEGQSLGLSSATQLPFLGGWTRLWKAAFEMLSLGKDWTFTVLAAPTAGSHGGHCFLSRSASWSLESMSGSHAPKWAALSRLMRSCSRNHSLLNLGPVGLATASATLSIVLHCEKNSFLFLLFLHEWGVPLEFPLFLPSPLLSGRFP